MKKKNILKLLMLLLIPTALVFYSCEKEEMAESTEASEVITDEAETKIGPITINFDFEICWTWHRKTRNRLRDGFDCACQDCFGICNVAFGWGNLAAPVDKKGVLENF